MKRIITTVFTISLLSGLAFSINSAQAAGNFSYEVVQQPQSNNVPLQGSVIYTPAGMMTKAVLAQPLSSETTYQGATVNATLHETLTYKNEVIAPAGSTITGTVIDVRKAGRAKHNGEIYIRFNCITTPHGYRIPVSAIIKTSDNTGRLKGGTKKDAAIDYAKETAIGAGGGAILGTVMGAVSGGSVGKGAVYGTAIGAGGGVVKGLVEKGSPIEIPTGAILDIYFDQPITISAPSGYNY